MTKEDEFLIEEYKQAFDMCRHLEMSYGVVFRNYATVTVWVFGILVLLFKEAIINGDLFTQLYYYQGKWLIGAILIFDVLYGIISLVNILKGRLVDVLYTARINFLRKFFLESKSDKIRQYLEDPTLSVINPTDIAKRPLWSWSSQMFRFVILLSSITSLVAAFIINLIVVLNGIYFIIIWILLTLILILVSYDYMKRQAIRIQYSLGDKKVAKTSSNNG